MFQTVATPDLKEARSDDKEKTQLANALRRAVNMTSRARAALTTEALGVFTTIWLSEDMPTGSVWSVDYHIVARTIAGVAGRARYDQAALFYREPAGSTTQQGATQTISPAIESIAAFSAQFLVSGNAIAVQVLDDGVSTVDWDALIEVREVK